MYFFLVKTVKYNEENSGNITRIFPHQQIPPPPPLPMVQRRYQYRRRKSKPMQSPVLISGACLKTHIARKKWNILYSEIGTKDEFEENNDCCSTEEISNNSYLSSLNI